MNQVTVYKIEVVGSLPRYSFSGHFAKLPTPAQLADIIQAEADKIRCLSDGDELDTDRCHDDADDLQVLVELVRAFRGVFTHSANRYRVTLARVEIGKIEISHVMVYDENAVPLISVSD